MTRILHLTLHREWFDKIARGEKRIEHRKDTAYWRERILGKYFDEVHFRNGYHKDSPFMRVEFERAILQCFHQPGHVLDCEIRIFLGKVLEIKNWP